MTTTKKTVYREGDTVRIIKPEFVDRVGYPKSVDDFITEELLSDVLDFVAEKTDVPKAVHLSSYPRVFGQSLKIKDHASKHVKLIAREIAYLQARSAHFGGSERTIHTYTDESRAGEIYVVDSVRTAYTGTYFPPGVHGSGYWSEDYDYSPGGLDHAKAHRILRLVSYQFQTIGKRQSLEIVRENVELVERRH